MNHQNIPKHVLHANFGQTTTHFAKEPRKQRYETRRNGTGNLESIIHFYVLTSRNMHLLASKWIHLYDNLPTWLHYSPF